MKSLSRFLPVAIILALLAVGLVWMLGGNGGTKTATAYFPRAVSIYEGSDVRVLGVPVGVVEEVVPEGTQVKVTLRYDGDVEVPMNAQALIVSPSVVGDRYVQLSPAYTGGEVLPDNSVLEVDRNHIPLELEEIYEALDEMVVAIGPDGANERGALTDLLEVTAENFGGQGEQFHQTIKDFGQLSGTLERNKDDLFASVEQLQEFMQTMADNDGTVRSFNRSLGSFSQMLSEEREELTQALR
jgi:phospholipid/cholesterol/gamma-HCH transport system substrate-binding protein